MGQEDANIKPIHNFRIALNRYVFSTICNHLFNPNYKLRPPTRWPKWGTYGLHRRFEMVPIKILTHNPIQLQNRSQTYFVLFIQKKKCSRQQSVLSICQICSSTIRLLTRKPTNWHAKRYASHHKATTID